MNKYNNEFYSAKSSKLKGGYGEFYGGNHIQITSQNDKQKLSNSYIPYSGLGNSINHVDERLKLQKKIEIDERLKLQKKIEIDERLKLQKKIEVDERLKLQKKIEIDERLKLQKKIEMLQKRTRYNPRQSGLPPRIVKNTYTLSRDFTFYERSSLPDGQPERLFGTADERLKLQKKIEIDERLKLQKQFMYSIFFFYIIYCIYLTIQYVMNFRVWNIFK
jgi:hypothetical protein